MRSISYNAKTVIFRNKLAAYLAELSTGRSILWCYVIWYLTILYYYFEPSLQLWLNSLGLSLIVGSALILATGPFNMHRFRTQFWQVSRLVICPFCVSSFSAQTAGKGFVLLFPPQLSQNLSGISACFIFLGMVYVFKRNRNKRQYIA